jgi:adenosine deaminase
MQEESRRMVEMRRVRARTNASTPLLEAGLMVTINSDDPAYFGGYIGENYIAAQEALSLGREDIERIAANSFIASFLPVEAKRVLLDELKSYTATR